MSTNLNFRPLYLNGSSCNMFQIHAKTWNMSLEGDKLIFKVHWKARTFKSHKQNGIPILTGVQELPKSFKIPKYFHWKICYKKAENKIEGHLSDCTSDPNWYSELKRKFFRSPPPLPVPKLNVPRNKEKHSNRGGWIYISPWISN